MQPSRRQAGYHRTAGHNEKQRARSYQVGQGKIAVCVDTAQESYPRLGLQLALGEQAGVDSGPAEKGTKQETVGNHGGNRHGVTRLRRTIDHHVSGLTCGR